MTNNQSGSVTWTVEQQTLQQAKARLQQIINSGFQFGWPGPINSSDDNVSITISSADHQMTISKGLLKFKLCLEIFQNGMKANLYLDCELSDEMDATIEAVIAGTVHQNRHILGSGKRFCLSRDDNAVQRLSNFNISVAISVAAITSPTPQSTLEVSSLAGDLKSLFITGLGTDFTIFCDSLKPPEKTEKLSFEVHKSILIGRSDVFAAMLSHSLREKNSNTMSINDLSPAALKELLHFFYTDNVDDINTHAKELLMASEKYNLSKLKKMSEESLCKNMKIDSVIQLAAFANLHNGHSVTKAAIGMIVKNFPQVIRNPDWPDFVKSHSDILVKIHDKLATKMMRQTGRFLGSWASGSLYYQVQRTQSPAQ